MINWKIAGTWQNWIIVFLMFSIAAAGIHLAWAYFDNAKAGGKDNGE